MNYFRITGYWPENDCCFILDSNGMFEKLWQFSSYLVNKGIEIIEASKEETMLDININRIEFDTEHIILRALAEGMPENISQMKNGVSYNAIKVADKIYIPNKEI